MRKLLATVLIALLPLQALAAAGPQAACKSFDVDSDVATYLVLKGQNGRPDGGGIAGKGKIKTTGSTVDVVAVDAAGTAPFDGFATGYLLAVDRGNGTVDVRAVHTFTDADTIQVDTAVDWENGGAGFDFRWWFITTCTDATCGALSVASLASFIVEIGYERGDLATGIEWLMECRGDSIAGSGTGNTWKQVFPTTAGTFSALATANAGTTSGRFVLEVTNPGYSTCRIAVRRSGADTADVVGTSTEQVDISISPGEPRAR